MKNYLFFIITSLMISKAVSQNYHPLVDTNKEWSTAHSWGQPFVHTSDYIKFLGDSTINGLVYKQVWRSNDTTGSNWTAYGFIREYNKQVFYLSWVGGAPNNLLYDFNAVAGDTISLFADPMGSYMVVDSVGTWTLLDGEVRRKMNLSCHVFGSNFGSDTWIEGIGSLFGVLQSGTCMLVGDNPQLMCFHENDTLKYFNPNFNQCYIATGIDSHNLPLDQVNVFQNSGSGSINIKIDDSSQLPLNIVLYDVAGIKLAEKKLNNAESKIEIPGIHPPSFLIYQLSGKNGFRKSGKISITIY